MEPPNLESDQQIRNWLELPSDVTANILNRIGMIDILENAQKVCTAWRKICLDPAMWRVINLNGFLNSDKAAWVNEIFKQAVDRSQGQLTDVTLVHGYNILALLPYVAIRSSQLRRLEIVRKNGSNYKGWIKFNGFRKFPLLEELSLYTIIISKEDIETVSRCCPLLKTLKVNREALTFSETESSLACPNETAIAIGENLVELRHLELIGNNMTNIGLQVILDGCLRLETLDLRMCICIDLEGDIGKRCSKQIKHLKLPYDSLEDCPYIYNNQLESMTEDEEDDYYYGNSPPELFDGYISQ